jgi:hypothetical protein
MHGKYELRLGGESAPIPARNQSWPDGRQQDWQEAQTSPFTAQASGFPVPELPSRKRTQGQKCG